MVLNVNFLNGEINFKAVFLLVEWKNGFFCGINVKKKWLKRDKIDMIFLVFNLM